MSPGSLGVPSGADPNGSAAAAVSAADPAPAPDARKAPGPEEVPAGMEDEAALYAAFCEVPVISRAVVRQAAGGGVTVTATLQQRNLPANAQRRYTVAAALMPAAAGEAAGGGAEGGSVPALVGLPQELHADVQLVSVAPSGSQQLIVLKAPNGDNGTSMVLQHWRAGRLVAELLVPKTLHGPLVNDGYFAAGAAWSADESAVAYTAETPATERTPSWPRPEGPKDAAAPKTWRGVGAAVEDWGELNTGKRPPAPFVLDLSRGEVLRVPDLPAEHSVGQPVWCPQRPAATGPTSAGPAPAPGAPLTGLVLAAWPHAPPPSFPRLAAAGAPRKLGVVACYNRSAHLYHVPTSRGADGALAFGPPARLAPSLDSAMSPAFSPGGEALVFVSQQEAVNTGTHAATARLYRLDWSPESCGPAAAEPALLVDVVDRPTGRTAFPGLYLASLHEDGFVGPSTLLLNTQWGAVSAIAALDTSGPSGPKAPVPLTPVDPDAPGAASWTLLGCAGGLAVASRVAPDAPPQLMVARLPADASALTAPGAAPLAWRPLELGAPGVAGPAGGAGGAAEGLPAAVREALGGLEYRVLRVAPSLPSPGGEGGEAEAFDCLVWLPKDRKGPLPAVLAPHGGPHTGVVLGWYPPYAFFAALGYAVLCPNYRGSTGYGQAALASLPGRAGAADVADCVDSVAAAVGAGLVDPGRVSIIGGSHGGFLTGHLLGQHPAAFRAGVMRNPVTNIAAMVSISDIPDWCYVEVLGCEEGRARAAPLPAPADLAAFFAASPAAHLHAVAAPLLVMLGAKDRRVPPPDGAQYLAALRGRDPAGAAGPAPPTRLIVFPEDTHALDRPQTEFEQWVNAAWWLKQYAGPRWE